jgi:hypothetical protein
MEVESTSVETTAVDTTTTAPETTPTTEAVETKASEPKGLDAIKTASPKTDIEKNLKDVPPVKDPYTPNYKFKVLDKELEIDEWLRPVIKSQDMEKKVKELYEKAYGLDSIKPKHQAIKEELEATKSKAAETDQALNILGKYLSDNDFDSFFEGLNIPKDKILGYALELVKREQMSPEQKAQWQASKQAKEAARYYEVENARLQQSQQQFAVQQRTFELDMALSQPEAKVVADTYNAGMGSPEAFKDYCIQIGQAYAARGQDIPANLAVNEAIKHLKAINPSLGVVPNAGAAQVVQASQKPVIPNIQGRGTSAVKPAVKSLEDLKKRAKELTEQY